MLVAISASAKDDSKYLAGAVPEQDGIVTFTKSFSVQGKSQQEVSAIMSRFIGKLVDESIPAPGNYARIMGENQDSIVARVCEWMVFKKKPLYLDRTRVRYQIKAITSGNKVTLSISNINYYYSEDMEGVTPEMATADNLESAEAYAAEDEFVNETEIEVEE